MASKEFDIFISYKSEDQGLAETAHDYFTHKGLTVFLSGKTLRELGSTEYHATIDDAIEESKHMVVVASTKIYVKSKWVEYEWRLFLGEILAGRKTGNLITLITPEMDISDLPISLRNREVFRLNENGLENALFYTLPEIERTINHESLKIHPSCLAISDFVVEKKIFLKDVSWHAANEHAKQLNVHGFTGWELPSVEQLKLIRQHSLLKPYCYWSKDEADSDNAYYIYADTGERGGGPKDYTNGLCAQFIKCLTDIE